MYKIAQIQYVSLSVQQVNITATEFKSKALRSILSANTNLTEIRSV